MGIVNIIISYCSETGTGACRYDVFYICTSCTYDVFYKQKINKKSRTNQNPTEREV